MARSFTLPRLALTARASCLSLAFLALVLLAVSLAWAEGPGDQTVRATLQQVIADESIQHDPPQPDMASLSPPWHLNLEWLRYPLWILLGIGVLALIWYAIKAIAQLSRASGPVPGSVAVEAAPIPQDKLFSASPPELAAIMDLARRGAYEAAIHQLLLLALSQLGRMTGANPAPSLTSREILRRPGLAAPAAGELTMLVGAVEISRFGGRPASEILFQSCLESYRRLIAAGSPRERSAP